MKRIFFIFLSLAAITAACNKSETNDSIDQDVSSIAYPVDQKKGIIGEEGVRIRFVRSQSPMGTHHLSLQVPQQAPYAEVPDMVMELRESVSEKKEDTGKLLAMADIFRIGKSANYRSEHFNIGKEYEFDVLDLIIKADVSDNKEYKEYIVFDGQIFLYPSGRVVKQNPNPIRLTATVHFIDDFQGETGYLKINAIIIDDPAQQIKSLSFIPDPIMEDPKDPKAMTYFKSIGFTKTHFNRNIGMSRWEGEYSDGKIPGTWSSSGAIFGTLVMGGGDPSEIKVRIVVKL